MYIALTSEMCIKIKFKINTLTNYVESNMLTQTLVLLPLDWDENDLLIKVRI